MDDFAYQCLYVFRGDPYCFTAHMSNFRALFKGARENSSIALAMSFLLGVIVMRLVSGFASEDEVCTSDAVTPYELSKGYHRPVNNVTTTDDTEGRSFDPSTMALQNCSLILVMSFLLGVIFMHLVSRVASEDESDTYDAVTDYELPEHDHRPVDNATGEETERRSTAPSSAISREKAPHTEFRDVWAANFDAEFNVLQQTIHSGELGSVLVGIDTECPGAVRCEDGTDDFGLSGIKYSCVRDNVNTMKLIQLGLAVRVENAVSKAETTVWQFHFQCDLDCELSSDPSLQLLVDAGVDFSKHQALGIPMTRFTNKMMTSELHVLMKDKEVRWVSFHGLRDFGFLVKLTYQTLPVSYSAFLQLMVRDFPRVVDLKYMLPTTSLAALGESLHVMRYGSPHAAGPDALYTLNCFLALDRHLQHYAFCYPTVGHFFALADDESANAAADGDHDDISEFICDAQEAAQERRERELVYLLPGASPDLISEDRTPESTARSNHSAQNSTQQETPRVPLDATSSQRYSEFGQEFSTDFDTVSATAYTTAHERYTGEQHFVNAEDSWWDPQWAHAQDWRTAMNGAKADRKHDWRATDDREYGWHNTMNSAPVARSREPLPNTAESSRPPHWSLATRFDWGTARNDRTSSSIARGQVPYQRNYGYAKANMDVGTSKTNRREDWYTGRNESDMSWKENEYKHKWGVADTTWR